MEDKHEKLHNITNSNEHYSCVMFPADKYTGKAGCTGKKIP
jgi:hypothetical protein